MLTKLFIINKIYIIQKIISIISKFCLNFSYYIIMDKPSHKVIQIDPKLLQYF